MKPKGKTYLGKNSIDRTFPYQVELRVGESAGSMLKMIAEFCRGLPVAQRVYYARRQGADYQTWCFARRADATAFQERFGGEHTSPASCRKRRLALVYASPTRPRSQTALS